MPQASFKVKCISCTLESSISERCLERFVMEMRMICNAFFVVLNTQHRNANKKPQYVSAPMVSIHIHTSYTCRTNIE